MFQLMTYTLKSYFMSDTGIYNIATYSTRRATLSHQELLHILESIFHHLETCYQTIMKKIHVAPRKLLVRTGLHLPWLSLSQSSTDPSSDPTPRPRP
jgi:hypothetical protein